MSVYLDGQKASSAVVGKGVGDHGDEDVGGEGEREVEAGGAAGGKGGGRWLFVSHDPVPLNEVVGKEGGILRLLFGDDIPLWKSEDGKELRKGSRLIHFKFEPMVCLSLLLNSIISRPRTLMKSMYK